MSGTDPTMAQPVPHHSSETDAVVPRRGPDLLTLAVGFGALTVAGTALLGGINWLPVVDARWVLAVIALAVGLMLVIGSLRHPGR
jgi:hypothetical protein